MNRKIANAGMRQLNNQIYSPYFWASSAILSGPSCMQDEGKNLDIEKKKNYVGSVNTPYIS